MSKRFVGIESIAEYLPPRTATVAELGARGLLNRSAVVGGAAAGAGNVIAHNGGIGVDEAKVDVGEQVRWGEGEGVAAELVDAGGGGMVKEGKAGRGAGEAHGQVDQLLGAGEPGERE